MADIIQQRAEEIYKFQDVMSRLGYSLEDIFLSQPKDIRLKRMIHQRAADIAKSGLGERLLKERDVKIIGIDRKYQPYFLGWVVINTFKFPALCDYLGEKNKREDL